MLFPDDSSDDVVDIGLITRAQVDSLLAYRTNCIAAAVTVATPQYMHYMWISDVWLKSN